MLLGLDYMDATVRGMLLLVAVVLFVIAAVANRAGYGWLVPTGLAFWSFTLMWDAFAAS